MNITATIDTSGLNRALGLAGQWTRRTPAEAVNTAALEIAVAAKNNMPFVTVPRIDSELATIATPVIGKRGKPLKRKKTFSSGLGSAQNPNIPLAVLIIQASARPGSNYNLRTNNRYALPQSPFKGVSRAAGAAAMAAAVHRLIAHRHSSISFLKAGWIPAVQDLLPYSVNRFRLTGGSPTEGARAFYGGDLGSAKPAQAGNPVATCIIENNIGYEGQNAASFNRALLLYGTPGLQSAIDNEGVKNMNYALSKAGGELELTFNKAAA